MPELKILQYTCMIVMVMLTFFIVTSHFLVVRKNKQYEQSRCMIAASLILFIIHYMLQITCKLREQGDDVGALVNIIFYAPAAILISCSQLNIQLSEEKRKKYIIVGIIGYAMIIASATFAVLYYKSLHIGKMIYLVNSFNIAILIYYIWMPYKELRKIRKRLDNELGNPAEVYSKTMRIGSLLMYTFTIISPLFILYTQLLFIFGPFALLGISGFVVSFTALGFNYNDITEVLNEIGDITEDYKKENVDIAPARMEKIERAVQKWKDEAGYRDPNLTLSVMTRRIMIDKKDFTSYLTKKYGQTFRAWLSDIRTEEAKRLLKESPDYSNELVSIECGFSSRVYFQRMFKEKTGLTPTEWKKARVS